MIFHYSFNLYLEDLYYEAIVNTWYDNYPILDISLIKKNKEYEKI